MASSLKEQIRTTLAASGQWRTVGQLVNLLGVPGRYETVARALRKLRAEGHVTARWLQPSRRHREWTANSAGQSASPVPTVPRPTTTTTLAAPTKGWAGRTIMSKPTLVAAVEGIVAEFVAGQKTFSAHDITSEIRTRSNQGTVTIDPTETGTVRVNGADVPRIVHEEIRDFVHDLFGQGKLANYGRANHGQYWEYAPVADDGADAADAADDDSADDGNGSGGGGNGTYDGTPSL